jgi:hypothetical protein
MSLSISRYLGRLGSTVVAVIAAASLFSVAYAERLISSFDQLCKIGVDAQYPLTENYILIKDIDASGSRELNGGAGFLPIGERKVLVQGGFGVPDVVDSSKAFRGTFDGRGYKINGLYINRTAADETAEGGINVGLFGFAIGAEIRNVTVVADSVVGYSCVGALVGRQLGGVVENNVAAGAVVGQAAVGGLVGMLEEEGAVQVCYSSAYVGGADVTDVGGLVGLNDAVVSESYTIGRVIVGVGNRVGGLAGSLTNRAKVLNCYSVAAVSGGEESVAVGGLVGKVEDGGDVRRSYSAGAVSGGAAGGLIGDGGGTAAKFSFWDTERSGCAASAGGAAGMTTAQMMSASAMNNLVIADAESWGISNNYPYLKNSFFPRYTATVTAMKGAVLSGDTAAGGAHTQRANHWIVGKPVVAMPSSDSILSKFNGWYLIGSDTALAVGQYDGFLVGQAASGEGATGTLLLAGLTADDIKIEARFTLKKHTLKYIAMSGRGKIESADDNVGEYSADTLIKLVDHGGISSVKAVEKSGHTFIAWADNQTPNKPKDPARSDTALSDITFMAYFTSDSVVLAYAVDDPNNGRLQVNKAAPPYVPAHTSRLLYGANGPLVEAIPIVSSGYHFVKWSDGVTDNPRVDSAATENVNVVAIFSNKYKVTYIAGAGGKIAVQSAGADAPLASADTAVVTVTVSAPPTPVASAIAVADTGYAFVRWSDGVTTAIRNDASARRDSTVTAIFDTATIAVKSSDRVIPNGNITNVAAQIRPVKATTGGLTAGPNPVLRQTGKVDLYWEGSKILTGTLLIFDANGNFVNKVIVGNINGINNSIDKRPVAAWNLTDAKGKHVNAGTYLIKGTLSTKNGKCERVALIVQLI